MLQDSIDEGISEPMKFLSQTFQWTPAQEAQFSRAVHAKTVSTLVKSVKGMEREYEFIGNGRSKVVPINPKIVGELAAIDFLDIIRSESLASPQEINSLRVIEALFQKTQQLNEKLMMSEARRVLGSNEPMNEGMAKVARLHKLIEKIEAQLPQDSAAKKEARNLLEQSTQAIATLKKICDLGL